MTMEDEVERIRIARELIKEFIPTKNDGKIPGPYKGYVASFVTNLNQLGIVPTLLNAYDSSNPVQSDQKPNRHDLIKLLTKWYGKNNDVRAFMEDAVIKGVISESDIIQKALALKQALRLFPLESSNPD